MPQIETWPGHSGSRDGTEGGEALRRRHQLALARRRVRRAERAALQARLVLVRSH